MSVAACGFLRMEFNKVVEFDETHWYTDMDKIVNPEGTENKKDQ